MTYYKILQSFEDPTLFYCASCSVDQGFLWLVLLLKIPFSVTTEHTYETVFALVNPNVVRLQ